GSGRPDGSNRGEIYHLGRGKPDRNDRGQPDRHDREGIFHIFHRSGLEDEWSNITVFTTVPLEGWRRASTSTVEDVRGLAGRPRALGDATAVFAHRRARRRCPRRWLRSCRIVKRVMKRFVFTALTLALLSSPAAASWRLIPGKPYDGH